MSDTLDLPSDLKNYLFQFEPNKFKCINRKYYELSRRIKIVSPSKKISEETMNKLPLEKVYKLYLYKPDFSKKIFKRFHIIKKVSMAKNKYITNKKLKLLSSIEKLELVYDKSITDKFFKNRFNLHTLKIIENNILTGSIFLGVPNLIKLKITDSFEKEIEGIDLSPLVNLEELYLENTSIKGTCLNNLYKLKNLTLFNTFVNDFQIENLKQLENLSLLEEENLTSNCLENLDKIKYLNIALCPLINERNIRNMIDLEYLDINLVNHRLDDTNDLFKKLTKLKKINDRCGIIHDYDIKYLNRSLKTLFINQTINCKNKIHKLTNIESLSLNRTVFNIEWLKNMNKLNEITIYYIDDIIMEDFFEYPSLKVNIYK